MEKTQTPQPPGRGWWPDPWDPQEKLREFDGTDWTHHTKPLPRKNDQTGKDASKPAPPAAGFQTTPDVAEKPKPEDDPGPKVLESKAQAKKREPAPGDPMPMFAKPATPPKKKTPAKAPESPPEAQENPWEAAPAAPEGDKQGWSPTSPSPEATSPSPNGFKATDVDENATSSPSDSFAPTPSGDSAGWGEGSPAEEGFEDDEQDTGFSSGDNAFVAATPDLPASSDKTHSKLSLPGNLTVPESAIAWVVVALIAVAAIVVPVVSSDPVKHYPDACSPIQDVLVQYEGTSDASVTSQQQQELAAIVSEGDLNPKLQKLVVSSVKNNNMSPVLEQCKPS